MIELKVENRPDRIWNLDQMSFCLDPSKTKVVGEIGVTATRTIHSSGKDNTSVLMACNSIGQNGPSLIIFKGNSV